MSESYEDLSPLSLVFHPSFWGLERRKRSHSYVPSEPLGLVYWIGLERGGRIEWTEAMSLREMCEQAAARAGISLPCPVPDQEILHDLQFIAQHAAFQRLQPVPYPDGASVEEMGRGGRRFSLHMEGLWWDDWKLYGNVPFDLAGIIRRGAEEIRHRHAEEYAPWKRLDALLVPILGPMNRRWYMHWGRPYGVHVTYRSQGETCSLYLGDPREVCQITPDELRAKLPPALLASLSPAQQTETVPGHETEGQQACEEGKREDIGGYLGPNGEAICDVCTERRAVSVQNYDFMPAVPGWPRYTCEYCGVDF